MSTSVTKASTVAVTVHLSPGQLAALASGVFTCTSVAHWREAQQALAEVQAVAARKVGADRDC